MLKSTHDLPFESAKYWLQIDDKNEWMRFRIGTVEGLWCCDEKSYKILSVINNSEGNGHFTDVLDWFKNSCQRDKKTLRFLEVMNADFKKHLITKRGFKDIGDGTLEIKY